MGVGKDREGELLRSGAEGFRNNCTYETMPFHSWPLGGT